ncbi:MAG TPA: hypothetical protein VF145_07155 [Chitinophagaceae bacterium]
MELEIIVEEALNYSVITLRNNRSGYEAEIYTFGALLNALRFPFRQSVINVVEGYQSPADAQREMVPFFRSAKLSPFVCRMRNGTYRFDGNDYKVEKFYLGEHALHGLLYDAVYRITESRTDQESASVVLHHHYDGSDNGYPFEFDISVEWSLSAANVLSCTTTVSHTNQFAIPYADGWHPYFMLDSNIDECYLQMDSSRMVQFDGALIPTGNIVSDNRFREKHFLKDVFLDNCFVLEQSEMPRVVLSSEQLRLTIIPEISYPYLQVYTPEHRRSIALENLSGIPDCFNNGIGLKMISPNETASFTTHYHAAVAE